MEIGRLNALILADDRDFNRKMDGADRKARATAGKVRSTFASLKLNMPDIGGSLTHASGNLLSGAVSSAISAITAGMTDFVKTGIQYNKTVENASVAFESLGMSAEGTRQHLADLEKLSLKTPFEYQDVIKASLSLNAFGFEARNRVADITALSDAAAIAAAGNGKFAESFQGIVMALGQMRSKNKVSAEEMNQLAERGIPAWDILAKKIGMTKAELMKLSEQGKVGGEVASRLLIEGLGQYAAGTGERLSKTTQGLESNAADAYAKRAGGDVTQSGALATYQDGLKRTIEGLDAQIGQSTTQGLLNRASESVQLIMDAISGRITGSEFMGALKMAGGQMWTAISDGFTNAIAGKGTSAMDAVKGWAQGIIKSAKDTLGIKSPSTVFAEIGQDVGEGFEKGIEDTINRTSAGMKKWAKAIEKAGGEEFLKAVEAMSKRLRVDPNKMMNVMAFESRLNPAQKNPSSSASGLIQFMDETAAALGTTTAKLRQMSAIEQLKYVEAYFQGFRRLADTQEAVYTAVLAGKPASSPDKVLFSNAKGRAGRNYRANAALDKDASGTITAREAAAQTYKQGFLSPAVEAAIKETAANTRVSAQVATQVAQFSGGALGSTNVTARANDSVVALGTLDQSLFQLSQDTALAKAALAPLAPGFEQAAGGMDRVTTASAEATKGLFLAGEAMASAAAGAERLKEFKERLGGDIDDLISSLIEGGGRWKDALANIAKDFFSSLAQEFMLAATGGKHGSIGSLLGGLLGGVFKGLFAGAGGVGPVPTFASGGDFKSGLALVGEQGPELVNFRGSGYVYNANETAAMMSQRVPVIHIHVPIYAPTGSVPAQTRQQIATQAAFAAQQAMKRNG